MTDASKPGGRDLAGLQQYAADLREEIDRRKVSEAELSGQLAVQTKRGAESEELFRMFVESVHEYAIFMLDPTGRVETWNTGAQRIKGYAAAEIIGSHFSRFYPESEVRAGKCEHELELATRDGRFAEEGWRLGKDGGQFWASVVISAVRDDDGELIGFSKITRDLTDRKRAEQAQLDRLAADERFRLLVESVRDYALFMLDPDGKVATWNLGAQRIKGYSADEIIGRHFSAFYPVSDATAARCDHELVVARRDGRFEEEGWRVRKDGSTFWASVVINSVHDRSGALIGFSKITRDLTERRRAEHEHVARLAAEHANRAKDEFLAMLGHELRNPMAPILTALELLRLRGADASSKEHQVIERQVKHMVRLVEDLLDVSRITSGKVEVKKRRLDLNDVIAKALETTSPLLEQKRHRIDVDLPPGELIVDGDDTRLSQVLTNLVTNAAKYTDPGGRLRVSARIEGGAAVIEVDDNGIGISPELLPRVFELFVQGQQSFARSVGGLGLGLTLVRTLIGLHGGTVSARSAGIGHGSTFTVRLPVAGPATISAAPATHTASPIKQDPKRILIVDDNEDARMLLAEILTRIGHHVATAADGIEALKVARAQLPEIAILDLGLPVMDGFELAATLRIEMAGAVPRLIALTGYGQQNDRDRTRAAGFDAHLVKPVNMQRLMASITEKT